MSLSIKPKETGVAWKTRFAVRQSAKLEQKPSGATWWEISVKCSWQSFSFQSLNRAHVQLCKFWEDLKRSNSSHTPYVQHARDNICVRCQRLIANATSSSLSRAISLSLPLLLTLFLSFGLFWPCWSLRTHHNLRYVAHVGLPCSSYNSTITNGVSAFVYLFRPLPTLCQPTPMQRLLEHIDENRFWANIAETYTDKPAAKNKSPVS